MINTSFYRKMNEMNEVNRDSTPEPVDCKVKISSKNNLTNFSKTLEFFSSLPNTSYNFVASNFNSLFTALLPPATGTAFKALTLPVQQLITKKISTDLPLKEVWKNVKTNPYKSLRTTLTSEGASFFTIFLTKGIAEEYFCSKGLSRESAKDLSKLAAATLATIVTQPLEMLKVIQQAGNDKKMNFMTLLRNLPGDTITQKISAISRGINPSLTKNIMTWAIGLKIAEVIEEKLLVNGEKNDSITILSTIMGWTLGNFMASPAFNAALMMRKNPEITSFVKYLESIGVLLNNGKKIEGTPLGKRMVKFLWGKKPENNASLARIACVENASKMWSCYWIALPMIIITGSAVSAARIFAENQKQRCLASEIDNNIDNVPFVEEIE